MERDMVAEPDDAEATGPSAKQPAEGADDLPPPSEGSPTPASVSGLKEKDVNPLAPPTIVEAGS
jgi:hypothetical protein